MNINNPTFQLPRDWTAEQAEFLSAILGTTRIVAPRTRTGGGTFLAQCCKNNSWPLCLAAPTTANYGRSSRA